MGLGGLLAALGVLMGVPSAQTLKNTRFLDVFGRSKGALGTPSKREHGGLEVGFQGPGGVGGVLELAIGGPRLVARAIARGKEDLQVQEVMARRASARG